MGRDADIRYVHYRYPEGTKGIHVLITLPIHIRVVDSWLEFPADRIHLGEPTDFSLWYSRSDALVEEEREEDENNL